MKFSASSINCKWALAACVMAVVMMLLAVADRAGGFSYFQWGGVSVTWPADESVRWLAPGTFPPNVNTEPTTSMLAAMGNWNEVPNVRSSTPTLSLTRITRSTTLMASATPRRFQPVNSTPACWA
jgi:hypothetical protein